MKEVKIKKQRKLKRSKRSRSNILKMSKFGARPRLSVFRSNRYLYAQIIDDVKGITIVSASEKEVLENKEVLKKDSAEQLGKIIAVKAKKAGIKEVVFDKGPYKFHGRIKNFADYARKEGMSF